MSSHVSLIAKILIRTGVAVALLCLAMPAATAQRANFAEAGEPDDPGIELLQEEPHDLLYLTEASGGGWAKLRLLEFPGRKIPEKRTGALRINVIGIETQDFVTRWSDVKKLDLWEDRLERETRERIAKGDFTGAYPFLSVLIRDYPNRPGLRQIRADFLWNDAVARAKKGVLAPTLAMLEELRRYAPEYKTATVLSAIDGTTDRLMQSLKDDNELDLAQQLLSRLEVDYQNDRLKSIDKWNKEFLRMAISKQSEAQAELNKALQIKEQGSGDEEDKAREAGHYRVARQLAREAIYLKPDIPNGQDLVDRIDKIYPLVNVGVLQSASVLDPTRIDNWASRRSGRLVYRILFEMKDAGPEGGEYDFLFGDAEMSPDRMSFDMYLENDKLPPQLDQIRSQVIADVMASRAQLDSPKYFAPWAAAVRTISIEGPKQVRFNLRRPHVMPISLLQIRVDGSWFDGEPMSPTGDYRLDVAEDDIVRYVLKEEPKTETQPREIVEIRSRSGSEAVSKLLQGEVDVLDQLFPADAIRLKRNKEIRVATYPLPTVHMLVPCSDHAFLSERTFRRALLYGINRHDILAGELLEGLETEGCRVVSGPFPAGIEVDDPLGYAYDQDIDARRYEPPLAKLLLEMNKNQMKSAADRKKEEMPELAPIRLAFPADNLSRVACEAIRSQWQMLGLEIELVQLPVGRSFPDEGQADIVYVAAASWEPIIDARRILGPEGLAGSEDQLVGLGLRRLEEAKTWREVRDRLHVLHGIAHHELPVLPLWQMVDSYAYRRDLVGVGSDIVTLYQNAGKWRLGR